MDQRTTYVVAADARSAHSAEEAPMLPQYLDRVATLVPTPLTRLAGSITPSAFIEGTLVVTVIAAWPGADPGHTLRDES